MCNYLRVTQQKFWLTSYGKNFISTKGKQNLPMLHQDTTCWISKFGIHPYAQQILPESLLMPSTIL